MNFDRGLFLSIACVLLGVGTLMVYSASATSQPTEFEQVYLSRHVTFLLVGVVAAAAGARLPARVWFWLAPYFLLVTVGLLAAVLIPGVGTEVHGARRWLRFGPISVQPSELAKLALPLFLASVMTRFRSRPNGWWLASMMLIVPVVVVVGLIVPQPDLGTAVFVAATAGLTLLLGGWPVRNFLAVGSLAAPALVWFRTLRPYQMRRITGFLETWTDWNQAPYQLKQSLVTFGAGGLLGAGIGKGWQKLSFLPEANTDFVFAVLGEELGLVGTLGVVALWCGLYVAGWRLLRKFDRRSFAFVAGCTLLTGLVLQAALNVAVVTAMVPPTGIPHPLISYGGSSLVVSMVALGIILSLANAQVGNDDAVLG